MFIRELEKIIKSYSKFPVIAILGPRQSGKTTLSEMAFPKHKLVSFENPLIREFAENDPEKFLKTNENEHGIIIDEFQYVPKILSYIKIDVDSKKRKNYFVLTGSQNFLMNQAITQSLAGRIGILSLLPLSLTELLKNDIYTRQAIVYNKSEKMDEDSFPCISLLHFMHFDNNLLNVKAFLRSSDVEKMLTIDFYFINEILKNVCKELGLKPGFVILFISNAHVYVEG